MKHRKNGGEKKRFGLIGQIYLLVFVSVLLIGVITYFSQYQIAVRNRKGTISRYVRQVAGETIDSVKEYPAYKWLLTYWYEHAAELDIEYDVDFTEGTKTEEKLKLLMEHQPSLLPRYADEEEVRAMPAGDQKLYAEIVYSWLITRLNEIKRNYRSDFLYCCVTDSDLGENPYGEQFFLFSAADPGAVRGTDYKEVYTIGTTVSVEDDETLQQAMRYAVEYSRTEPKFSSNPYGQDDSGNYLDEYTLLGWIGSRPALVGISFDLNQVVKDVKSETRDGTFWAMLYQFLLLQIIMVFILFFFIRPLKKVAANIRGYTIDKDSSRARANLNRALSGRFVAATIRHNEIGQLTEDFLDLTSEMDEHVRRIEKITADKKRIEVELDVASKIQEQMLPDPHPSFPEHPGVNLGALMNPAKEVGGDFYDYFMVDDDHLALVVADVSNKGVPAALFMVIAKTLIKDRAVMGESPEELLYHVNNQLNERNETNYFVTVWIAIVELSTGKGVAANAGHEHPTICRRGGAFELVTYRHAPAVGIMENIRFRQHTFELEPGDRLFVYTDGVPEATNKDQELFGTDRMLECLNRNKDKPNAELLQALRQDIDEFAQGVDQFDDITMLAFWYEHA